VNDLPWWGKAGRGALHVKNWELGVVLRPDPERPLQMDWPYRPETLRPYAAGEKIALRSALREIRSTYWKQIAKERRAVEAQEAAATAAATAAAEVIAPRADPSGGYIENDPTAAVERTAAAHSAETELRLVREWVRALDEDDVDTIYRQDIDGSNGKSSGGAPLSTSQKRDRLVEHIAALQKDDSNLQGNPRSAQGEVSVGWLTWTHKGLAEPEEIILDVAGCQ
jgi:hypothetical protein